MERVDVARVREAARVLQPVVRYTPVETSRPLQEAVGAAGRFLSLRVDIADRPGSLAALLALVGDLGGNVLDVEHSRVGSSLSLGEVEVALRLETRGAEHCDRIVEALGGAGFRVLERR
ncbi:ACT domain-containing protein [Nakamurella sp.]|uniref:ACT domain-containing protein n=1 Tax=Nakamurella sp. TaxID=1869182 RepID=UPI003B3A1135